MSLYSDWPRTCVRQSNVADNYKIGIPLSSGNTTVAYAVGPAGAGFLLEGSRVIKCPVDGYLVRGWLHGVRGLHCQPFPCIHDDGGKSLIGKRVAPPAVGLNWATRKLSQLTDSIFKRIYTMRSLIGPARR